MNAWARETAPLRILIVEDEENMRHMLGELLQKAGYAVETAADGSAGLEKIRRNRYEFILCDVKMPKMGGMEFLETGRDFLADTSVIMMSAYGTIDTAVAAMKQGAYDFITKPFKTDEVLLALKKAEEKEILKRENLILKERIRNMERYFSFGEMVSKSRSMDTVFQIARKVAPYQTTVLVVGDSGTGKELMARGVHGLSNCRNGPWIPVNCGGIPESLLESELFGYKKGAFTGADRDKKGLLEEADGGTLFLDEIGELPLSLQVKLLRFLQESEIRPVGGAKTKTLNVRVIAATARHLEDDVRGGRFREDLYYRLNVMAIRIPPLKDRPEDIPVLAAFFLEKFNDRFQRQVRRISPAAMDRLFAYPWPGNVRELENVIERAMVLTEGDSLEVVHFSVSSLETAGMAPAKDLFEGYSLKSAVQIVEANQVRKALAATGGNRTRAARLLEISHPSLLSKMKRYGLK
jgi:two-component system, NtrC family, response regulator AtoC